MRKNNRKGFTIVELVIVIAVIAILAGVLIPTFSGIVKKAQLSAAAQEATNVYKEAYGLALANDGMILDADGTTKIETVKIGGTDANPDWTVEFNNTGTTLAVTITTTLTKYTGYTFTYNSGAVTATKS
jgi:type IV pilus assembly protein PilA